MVRELTITESIDHRDSEKQYRVRIGRNAGENDKIIQEASQNDVWFHLAAFPSCHLIISCSLNALTPSLRNQCAQLVKNNTKYRDVPNLRVNFIEIKYVKRTEIPGRVILKKTPDSILI